MEDTIPIQTQNIYKIPRELSKHDVHLVQTEKGALFFDVHSQEPICMSTHDWSDIKDIIEENNLNDTFECTICKKSISGPLDRAKAFFTSGKKKFKNIYKHLMMYSIQYILFYFSETMKETPPNIDYIQYKSHDPWDQIPLWTTPSINELRKNIVTRLGLLRNELIRIFEKQTFLKEEYKSSFKNKQTSYFIQNFHLIEILIGYYYKLGLGFEDERFKLTDANILSLIQFPAFTEQTTESNIPKTIIRIGEALVSIFKDYMHNLFFLRKSPTIILGADLLLLDNFENNVLPNLTALYGVMILTDKICEEIWNFLF